jgi:anthranilate synthase component 1
MMRDQKSTVETPSPPALYPEVLTLKRVPHPASLYFSIRSQGKPSFLLESAAGPGEKARFSVIGWDPLLYLRIRGEETHVEGDPGFKAFAMEYGAKGDSLEKLKRFMGFQTLNTPQLGLRYALAFTGYIGYDYVRELMKLDCSTSDDLRQPTLEFILPSKVVVIDHLSRKTHYIRVLFDDGERRVDLEGARWDLKRMAEIEANALQPEIKQSIAVSSNMSRREFEQAVERAKQYTCAGDIIQVVLSRRLCLKPSPEPENFYRRLSEINPSPYMFFLDFPERSVIGSSPEILVRVEGQEVVTRPIAGTRRRGKTPADEKAMRQELLADEKERAEHVMLVDLGRNDIGKVSRFGSVRVSEFMRVEIYSHVQHLVSHVVGKLKPGKDAFDALRATFPAGTVTGAPKDRAMEIIEELEPTRRGIYAGALGSFSYTGDADLAITIRTLLREREKAYIQVGAGVVAYSVPWKEYYETENKAKALLAAAGCGE